MVGRIQNYGRSSEKYQEAKAKKGTITMKRFIVTVEFHNCNRKNELGVWAENAEEAKARAIKWWGITMYKNISAIEK